MIEKMFHTPEGVRDVYNGECEKKRFLTKELGHTIHSYGYQDIETPTFEYFDIFSREIGTTPSRDLYKFFDREGNTLVLRPDFTPSIARAAAKYYLEDGIPVRLCYQGSTFINNSSYQGRLKESTEMGVELLGDSSVEADAEILALVVELLQKSGLTEFQISVGQVDFFKALIEEAGMSDEIVAELRELISNKNYFGVNELIAGMDISDEIREIFRRLPRMFGSIEVLEEAEKLTTNPRAIKAIERLKAIYDVLGEYDVRDYISFDLGMLSKYKYYTGIIFSGYTYGSGEPLIKGGRYDDLMAQFMRPAPAIGFALVMEQVMNALSRQGIETDPQVNRTLILYTQGECNTAIREAGILRKGGDAVECIKVDNRPAAEQICNSSRGEIYSNIIFLHENGSTQLKISGGETK